MTTAENTARQAAAYMQQGYSWSEAIVLAVGEVLWGQVDDRTRMISTAFSGGLGGTRAELCGALSGGALLIGAQRGRKDVAEDNVPAKALTARYREAFVEEFGMTICADLRANGYGGGGIPCSTLVAQAVPILLALLEEE